MIRVNLLAGERRKAPRKLQVQLGQQLTLVCSLILVATALLVGWRYWALAKESAQLNADIASAQAQTAQLQSIIGQVQQFEQRKAQLQQRVGLIEQLRKDQTGPVHILDQISRSLPSMLWLTELKQGAKDDEVLVEGRCTTLTGLSDFVASLEASGYFRRSIEIVSTVSEPVKEGGELIKFQIKAVFERPGDRAAAAPQSPASVTSELKPRG